jgi:hypothetical protein
MPRISDDCKIFQGFPQKHQSFRTTSIRVVRAGHEVAKQTVLG